VRRAKAAGIARTVLFAAFHSDYALANEEVARIVERCPGRFWGFVFLHGERDRRRAKQLVGRYVGGRGFRGIKVHRRDARISREICEAARQFRVPVLYDVFGEVQAAHLLAGEYPDVDFIIPHLGSFADDWAAQMAFVDSLARYPNIYTDTSGVRRFDVLERAVKEAGAGKVLFGTDGPWLHPGVELAKVRALELNEGEERAVLSGNLLRLFKRRRTLPCEEKCRCRAGRPCGSAACGR
jgi:predicted TIM-barrel fold metal-dependent hydrolase